MKKSNFLQMFILFIFIFGNKILANNLNDSNKIFAWAEINYSQYFTPSNMGTFEIDGYLARYYPETGNYVGTKNDNVYVYGNIFNGLMNVGLLSDYSENTKNIIFDREVDYGDMVSTTAYPNLCVTADSDTLLNAPVRMLVCRDLNNQKWLIDNNGKWHLKSDPNYCIGIDDIFYMV